MTAPARRSLVAPLAAVVVTFAVLVLLGTWQLQRLSWKEALISRVEARVDAEAEPLPDPAAWPALDATAIEYRPVRLAGRFDHSREVHVFIALGQPRGPLGGQGYFIVTPLVLDEGNVVFVNRGFVPAAFKDPATREEGQVAGHVEIEGLMRPAEEATSISPDPDIAKNVWFVRNPAAMAGGVGIDPAIVAPFTVDARADQSPGGLPQGGETVVAFSNNHLGYAITWYGLAAALVGVSVAFLRRWRTQPGAGPGGR